MASDTNYKYGGGLTYSSLGVKGTHTRVMSLQSPELTKLRDELKTSPLNEHRDNITLREILDRLDDADESAA